MKDGSGQGQIETQIRCHATKAVCRKRYLHLMCFMRETKWETVSGFELSSNGRILLGWNRWMIHKLFFDDKTRGTLIEGVRACQQDCLIRGDILEKIQGIFSHFTSILSLFIPHFSQMWAPQGATDKRVTKAPATFRGRPKMFKIFFTAS